MSIKINVSIVALIVFGVSSNAYAVRVNNPGIVKELNKFYAQMEQEGRLGELSTEAKKVCSCVKRGGDYDQDSLIKAIREAQEHGYLIGAHAHPALLARRVNNQ